MTITKCKECDGAVSRKARNLPALMRIATALIISLMLHTQAVADNIPTQQHNPSKCPLKDDPAHKACIADFWREYRPALMSEYLTWKALLPIAQGG